MRIEVIIVIIASVIVGFIIGILMAKFAIRRQNKRIKKIAKEVLEGKRENYIEIDGIKYPAKKFRLKDEKGNEKVIDLKGGIIIQDGKEKNKERIKENFRDNNPIIGENSTSIRKEKRNIRGRTARIRRYG